MKYLVIFFSRECTGARENTKFNWVCMRPHQQSRRKRKLARATTVRTRKPEDTAKGRPPAKRIHGGGGGGGKRRREGTLAMLGARRGRQGWADGAPPARRACSLEQAPRGTGRERLAARPRPARARLNQALLVMSSPPLGPADPRYPAPARCGDGSGVFGRLLVICCGEQSPGGAARSRPELGLAPA